jgi:hypothetical protein
VASGPQVAASTWRGTATCGGTTSTRYAVTLDGWGLSAYVWDSHANSNSGGFLSGVVPPTLAALDAFGAAGFGKYCVFVTKFDAAGTLDVVVYDSDLNSWTLINTNTAPYTSPQSSTDSCVLSTAASTNATTGPLYIVGGLTSTMTDERALIQIFFTPCFSQPCQNGGTCFQWTAESTFYCSCATGFGGSFCQTPFS